MSLNFKDIVGNIFYTDKKEEESENEQTALMQNKLNNILGTNNKAKTQGFNPYLKSNGELYNPYLNYQSLLDSDKVNSTVKSYITNATGLKPTVTFTTTNSQNTSSTKKNTTTSSTGKNIADSALKYLGTPYVWGGESMEEGGMDCSGFVYNALKDSGYDIGRTTAQGYRSQGTVVSQSEMQPGDLIFFGSNPNNASHIGIYIGNGQMIHSSGGSKNTKNNPGKGVSIVNVNHRKDFLEARRY